MSKQSPPVQSDIDVEKRHALVHHPRPWWQKVPFTSTKNPPFPKRSLDDADPIPEASANLWDRLTFGWITPLMSLGYARPLEATDLWKLQDDRKSAYIAALIEESFARRVIEAAEYNERLEKGEISPGFKRFIWSLSGKRAEKEREWREKAPRAKASLLRAMNDSVKWWFWSAGALKVVGDVAQTTSPLIVKAIITFAAESYRGHRVGGPVPSIGKGIGLVFALIALQVISSMMTNHYTYRSTSTGVLIRGGLITAIYNRSLRLTARARSTLTNGKLINHISTDVSRIDFAAGYYHSAWTAPIQLLLCLALLIVQLGPSALAGFGIFFFFIPIQGKVMRGLFAKRALAMEWTDKRAKLLQELLGGMKIIKYFAWEVPFLDRLATYRMNEVKHIGTILLVRAGMGGIMITLPTLASIVAFVVYSSLGHSLEPSIIFTSLTLFTLLRIPLMALPLSIASMADAFQAISRLTEVFEAELLEKSHTVDDELDVAIDVKGGSFTWDAPPDGNNSQSSKTPVSSSPKEGTSSNLATVDEEKIAEKEDHVFKLHDVNLSIPRGQLVAIVGPVGSGKTSLLQGLIGEMRKTSGTITFGGSVAYCSQIPWIQNATIRENICFGRPFDEDKYWNAVRAASLEADLDMLPHGDLTEVGEKGISLSGGQKQRVSICRAVYSDTDIQIFDDPLSALDAHVGRAVFQKVLHGKLAGKTRVLVTHALHFLPQVDYVYVIADGRLAEQGTYADLISRSGEFSHFIKEFGSSNEEQHQQEVLKTSADPQLEVAKHANAVAGESMMQAEERNTGAVTLQVYLSYIKAGRGHIVIPLILLWASLIQVANVLSSYWLIWWQEFHWGRSNGFYMGIYAGLGVGQAFVTFLMGASFALMTYFSAQRLHKDAITRLMYAPMLFFETTPLGRIMNRFSKDIDTIDNALGESFRLLVVTTTSILGALILISVILPWFLIAVFAISVVYAWSAAYYRASARELKRLDSTLRSSLYSHFSESLSGIPTIRAYRETERFFSENQKRVDIENRAYWLTVTNQRWLGIRLDFLGTLLTFVAAMLAVGTRFAVSPAQTGVVLSYILNIQLFFGWLIRQISEVENNMNAVERIDYYAKEIEQEAPHYISETQPPASWPQSGQITLQDVVLAYRPTLPPVLKGLSMSVKAGEKIGIIGRTGAGKSSLMTALYRLVELSAGSISLDGVDISTVGLHDLRKNLAIIPQEPLLFSGTLRSNLDPFNKHDDATLWDALKSAHLVEGASGPQDYMADKDLKSPSGPNAQVNKFTLDSVVEDEGNNLSVGQRSLVSLARAMVKNSKIIILDEATASVDYETDAKIQKTIATAFQDKTILCIAHRLRTIISYDRICVLDAGEVAEYDTPANLWQISDGIFRGMCERSSITFEDIQLASGAAN